MPKYHKVFSIACFCPKCQDKGAVYDSRPFKNADGLVRRRRCKSCGFKWETIELNYDEFKGAYNEGRFD